MVNFIFVKILMGSAVFSCQDLLLGAKQCRDIMTSLVVFAQEAQ